MSALSLYYFAFLAIVALINWGVKSSRTQNAVLLVSSLVFYGCWDWRCLWLIIVLSLIAYLGGYMAYRGKRAGAIACIVACLSVLLIFKYYNFFAVSIASLFPVLRADAITLKLVLPLGLSFVVFKAVSYIADCAKQKLVAPATLLDVMLYVSFFPQVAAGPIDRATNLLPQFAKDRQFDLDVFSRGVAQVMYGLFKKMVVADTLCSYVDKVYDMPSYFGGAACLMAAIFYSIQIYCDFSGYSDIACGSCRILGIEPMMNFDRPYLERNFSGFWRRWHMSLTKWFTDYVYIPLGGSRVPFLKIVRNTWVVFLLSGLWHGAAWTFVVWGAIHAAYITMQLLVGKIRKEGLPVPNVVAAMGIFICVSFAWVFFRADNFHSAMSILRIIVDGSHFDISLSALNVGLGSIGFVLRLLVVFLLALSYLTPRDCGFKTLQGRFWFTAICFVLVTFLGAPSNGEFIYFKF